MKVSGSYESLLRGVSQQVPHNRAPGQHGEQVNFISDPVNGLVRRHGSVLVSEAVLPGLRADIDYYLTDTNNYRSFEYSSGSDYVVLFRTATRPTGMQHLPAFLVYNRTTSTFLTLSRNVVDAQLDVLEQNGVSSVTAVGKFLFLAANNNAVGSTSTQKWDTFDNLKDTILWVRGGAFSRTYTATVTPIVAAGSGYTLGTPVTISYTTPSSSYQTPLDTSDISLYALDSAGGTATSSEVAYVGLPDYKYKLNWYSFSPSLLTATKGGAPMTNVSPSVPSTVLEFAWAAGGAEVTFSAAAVGATDITISYTHAKTVDNAFYTKLVNDRVNSYTGAVTAWIGTSTAAVQPSAIAAQLAAAATTAGLAATVTGSHVLLVGVAKITVDDGGDGTLLLGVGDVVESATKVSALHRVGKVVKVRGVSAKESYYLKAVAKDEDSITTFQEVTWVEGAGVEHSITSGLMAATVVGNTFHVAGSPTLLTAVSGVTLPEWSASTVGDDDSSPLPFFVGRSISYLGTFQNRLLIGSNGVLAISKVDDYLNVFRSTVLTIPADDPFEMQAQGSEDDVIKYGTLYDRDLILFGTKRQYIISGRQVMAPTSASMTVLTQYQDVADSPPITAGGLIFYAKKGIEYSALNQIQPGQNGDSPEAFTASSQIDSYLAGNVIELANITNPDMVFLRTTGSRRSVYVFGYMDSVQGRKLDSWSRWDFNPVLGIVIGMATVPAGLLVFSLRQGQAGSYIVCDFCSVTTGLSSNPYLDSNRPWATVLAGAGSVVPATSGEWGVAFDAASTRAFTGSPLAQYATLIASYPTATGLRCGAFQEATVELTNPYMKSGGTLPILSGRLTVTKLLVGYKESSGMSWAISYRDSVDTEGEFNGRTLDDPNNVIGREPVSTGQHSIAIGRETRQYAVSISARKWLPLTLTSIEWTGQFFNRTQRY